MKLILLVLICFSCSTINTRLIEKITDRTLTTETKTTGSSPPVRLTREAFEEYGIGSGTGTSKEDHVGSDEQDRPNNKRTRYYTGSKSLKDDLSSIIRVERDSHEKVDKPKKNTTASQHVPSKQKPTLVKKPIPKFNEMDYDDDFQMKISRSPVRVVDSGEHEDEDFNLDDYDFDINHDEFIGRGKPLEPRLKHKMNQQRSNHQSAKHETKVAPHPEVKTESKPQSPAASHRPTSNKRERAIQDPPKRVGEKEDYYDDATSTPKAPVKEKAREIDDEFNEDNEESKELEGKSASVRTIRSPWKINSYADTFGDKSSSVVSKVLSILPMFPQVPNDNGDEEIIGSSMDPWPSKP